MNELEQALLDLVPVDGSSIGNQSLLDRLKGPFPDLSEDAFWAARDSLIEQGLLQKDRARGDSVLLGQSDANTLVNQDLNRSCEQFELLAAQEVSVERDENTSSTWDAIVKNLLPFKLTNQVDACVKLLQDCFRGSLPHGVIQAVATLSALGFEQQARMLLVDFFKEHRDAPRLYRLLQMQLLFRERSEKAKEARSTNASPVAEHHSEIQPKTDSDWEWAPSREELDAPDVDDSSLRKVAASLQERIGIYRAIESGTKVPELEELASGKGWLQPATSMASDKNHNDSALLDRTSRLGQTALDLLKYFSDNPGDKAVHAETVLGYPMTEIRRLLLGSLGHYLRKTSSGGWECYPWVCEVLSALEETRNES